MIRSTSNAIRSTSKMIRSTSNACSIRFDAGANRGYDYSKGNEISIHNFEQLCAFIDDKFSSAVGTPTHRLVPLDILTDILVHVHACTHSHLIESRVTEGKMRYNMLTRRFEGDMSKIKFDPNWFRFIPTNNSWKLLNSSRDRPISFAEADVINGISDITNEKYLRFFDTNKELLVSGHSTDPYIFFEQRFVAMCGIVHKQLQKEAAAPYFPLYAGMGNEAPMQNLVVHRNPIGEDKNEDYDITTKRIQGTIGKSDQIRATLISPFLIEYMNVVITKYVVGDEANARNTRPVSWKHWETIKKMTDSPITIEFIVTDNGLDDLKRLEETLVQPVGSSMDAPIRLVALQYVRDLIKEFKNTGEIIQGGALLQDDAMERLASMYAPKCVRLLIYLHLLKKKKLSTSNLIGEAVVNMIVGLCMSSKLLSMYMFDFIATNLAIAVYIAMSKYTDRKLVALEFAVIIMAPYYALVA